MKQDHSILLRPVPDKLIVLTFDDAVSNHATLAGPLMKQYGFGGTFFVCEFPPDFGTNKQQYMTWEQVKWLHDQGFEIGNHTGHHTAVTRVTPAELIAEIEYLEGRCREHGIPKPVTFCYPGGDDKPPGPAVYEILKARGFGFARAGESRPYCPLVDHPLLVPSFPVHGSSQEPFLNAVQQARDGQIVVLMFHGLPEYTHPWVDTPPELFKYYLQYLRDNHYIVIAMRDLAQYVDSNKLFA
jgi:peptidoglycan/xylan/chitin deacetylase (PgdA/CDA1 family)